MPTCEGCDYSHASLTITPTAHGGDSNGGDSKGLCDPCRTTVGTQAAFRDRACDRVVRQMNFLHHTLNPPAGGGL